ncbi:MAG: acetylglutamate kinase [Pirellulaceae bacterium]|nr:acetylglutamate kinase [Pirellulaceae bacterium]
MQEAIAKADTLIEALGWIRRFRDKVTVIKLGGSLLEHPELLLHVLIDIVFMETVGMRPVVVHGGGAAISRAMDAAGIVPRFIQGRRYTDDRSLEIVERVLGYELNEWLAARIEELGGRAMNLNFRTTNVLFGERITLTDQHGEAVDLGHVGQVTRVDRAVIDNLCYAGQVPVIPSLCLGPNGEKLNVNADTGGGMIPKVEACIETLSKGVRKIHIIDGRIRHSLLLEVYTTSGIGTEIVLE